jgi:hypothetical protein
MGNALAFEDIKVHVGFKLFVSVARRTCKSESLGEYCVRRDIRSDYDGGDQRWLALLRSLRIDRNHADHAYRLVRLDLAEAANTLIAVPLTNHGVFKAFGGGATRFAGALASSCAAVQSLGGKAMRQNSGEGFTNSIPISCLSNC